MAKQKIKNVNQLSNIINERIKKAMQLTQDIIYDNLQNKIQDYYNERVFPVYRRNKTTGIYEVVDVSNVPYIYERTNELGDETSFVNDINIVGNRIIGKVGFSDSYLEFQYSTGKNPSGLEVLQQFNRYGHGAYSEYENYRHVSGEHAYWNELIAEINMTYGGIQNLFLEKLKEVGLKVK